MSKTERAAQMLAMAIEKQPKRQAKRGKFWIDETLQVNKSWAAKLVLAEHKSRSKL